MLFTAAIALIALAVGAFFGRRLARRGVTLTQLIDPHPLRGTVVLAAVVTVGGLLLFGDRIAWMPEPVLLYSEEYAWPALRLSGWVMLGLLPALEWGNVKEGRAGRVTAAMLALAIGVGHLAYVAQPVSDALHRTHERDGVVLQTTSYTCAPASIATLARLTRPGLRVSEREVAEMLGTTREGTSTLAEIRVMDALGLRPSFARGLTLDSLVARGAPAVLHVDAPTRRGIRRHAIALLAVDPVRRTVTIGDPMRGRQVKRFEDLDRVWIGEAVFVTVKRVRHRAALAAPGVWDPARSAWRVFTASLVTLYTRYAPRNAFMASVSSYMSSASPGLVARWR
jgi:predicted double-glycine peptidase